MALPHLPAAVGDPRCPQFSMELGYRAILLYVNQFPDVELGMRNFLIEYIHNYWFLQVGPNLISVFGEEYRTNNNLESFHSTLLVQMSKHPNIWQFLREEAMFCVLHVAFYFLLPFMLNINIFVIPIHIL